jgi:hypothetical protein
MFHSFSTYLTSMPFDWERFVSVVGVPGAMLLALGWFLARAWREFSPLLRAWLESQLENDHVHRQAVRQMTARQDQLQLGHARTHRALAHTARAIAAACPEARHRDVQPHVEAACAELANSE